MSSFWVAVATIKKTRQGLKRFNVNSEVNEMTVATIKKTRQGLKHRFPALIELATVASRNDQENPPGIETSFRACSGTWYPSRNDQENPPGIETRFHRDGSSRSSGRNDQENPPGIETSEDARLHMELLESQRSRKPARD